MLFSVLSMMFWYVYARMPEADDDIIIAFLLCILNRYSSRPTGHMLARCL